MSSWREHTVGAVPEHEPALGWSFTSAEGNEAGVNDAQAPNVSLGEMDLGSMLASLSVHRRPDTYTFVSVSEDLAWEPSFSAIIREREGTTVITTVDDADRRGWQYSLRATWLTIEVHSSLEAVGLTAAFSEVLARYGIPANVVAGYFHDHILVPSDRVTEAVAALESLRRS